MEPDRVQKFQLTVKDDVKLHQICAVPGDTLMLALRSKGVSIGGICGGAMMCGTCHVLLEPSVVNLLRPPSPAEVDLLEFSAFYEPARSRLACQLIVGPELQGVIEVAPDD